MTQQAPQLSQEELFEMFWRAYPKRVNKGDARKAWTQLKPSAELVQRMLVTLAWQRETEDWTKSHRQFCPYPASWIRAEGWENEQPDDVRPAPKEHWRDECSRIHGGTCHNALWHQAKRAQAS